MRASLRIIALPLLLLSAFLVATSLAAEPQAIEVRGYQKATRLPLQGADAPTTNIWAFSVVTDGLKLLIRCNAGTSDKGVDYSEFGTDGSNGFHFAKSLLQANPSSLRGLRNDATMQIKPSPLPGHGKIQNVWNVYAGQLELKRRTNSFLKPREFIMLRESSGDQDLQRMLNEHLLLRAEWEVDDQKPHVLKTFVDFRDGMLASDRYSQSLIPPEFMTGKTNSRMDVLSWTNIAGFHVPVHARSTTYITDTGKPGEPLQELFVRDLVATNIVAGSVRPTFVPKLSKATSVFDYRFAEGSERPAEYLATNGIILNTWEEAWAEVQRQSEEGRTKK